MYPGVYAEPRNGALRSIAGHFGSKRVEDELLRLADIQVAITADAGLALPKVFVYWAGWHVAGGVVCGAIGPCNLAGLFEWCILLPVSYPLLVPDDRDLRRLLCHEGAHCYWHVLTLAGGCVRAALPEPEELSAWPVQEQISYARHLDAGRLASPGDWFGSRDAREFMWDAEADACLRVYAEKYAAVWVRHNLPTREPPLCYRVTGDFGCDSTIAQRARQIKGSSPRTVSALLEVLA